MHDLDETNPGLTLFLSRTTMVLFSCTNKSSRNGTELCEEFLYNKQEFLEPRPTRGGHLGGDNPPGRAPLSWRTYGLYPPGGPADAPPDTINSHYSRKNQGERIITIHETEPPPSPVLPREGRSGVRLGLRRGGSSFFIITNPSPSPIP